MRSLNVGIRVKQDTTLTVTLSTSEVSSAVRIARGSDTKFQPLASSDGRRFAQLLAIGDYVLVVDCDSTNRPITVATDADVAFWSINWNAPDEVPPWVTWIGRVIAYDDPKNPWPPPAILSGTPTDAFLRSFLTSNSPVTATMQQLRDTFTGKGTGLAHKKPRTHALLIGIDKYSNGAGRDGAIYRDLRGCVHDVLEVEKWLRANIPGIYVTLMIAPRQGGRGSGLEIAPDCVPTYSNIVAKWRKLADTAEPGDIAYIHYSGHGGRAKTKFLEYKPSGLDESIAPCDINDRERGRYLRDVEIATLLQRMARRELVTTVVLDSCHSGEATRGDQAQTRQGDKTDNDPRGSDALPSEVGTRQELEKVAADLARSPLGPEATWRIDSALGRATSLTTVIAACRGQEAAYEYAPEGDQRCGALTYFWLKALTNSGERTTYRQIYDQVFGDVRNVFATQTPILLGEQDRKLFGTGISRHVPSVPVTAIHGNEITLRAGAPILSVGMHLALVPPDRLPELVDLSEWPEIEVIRVSDELTSVGRRVPNTGLDKETQRELPIVSGSQGIVRSYPPRMQRAVRLHAQPEIPNEVFDRLAEAIKNDHSKLLVVSDRDGGDYQVLVQASSYRVCDTAGTPLHDVSPVSVKDGDGAGRIVAQLVHLARFSNALQLANNDPSLPLSGKLELEVLDLPDYDPSDSASFKPVALAPGPARIEHGSYFCLRVRSRSAQYLQMALIDLQSNWAIDTLIPDAPQLSPFEIRDFRLQATIPDPKAVTGRDVLKVLATREPVNAALLTLPALGKPYLPKGPRGPGESQLDDLFRILQAPPSAHRTVKFAHSPSSGWMTAQTEIEVYRRLPLTAETDA